MFNDMDQYAPILPIVRLHLKNKTKQKKQLNFSTVTIHPLNMDASVWQSITPLAVKSLVKIN